MSVQPIERNTVTYFLYFEKEDLTLQIDKPIGLEKADFEIKQNDNGYGRYLTFADSVNIEFSPRLNHQFKKLCDTYKMYKWQTGIYFIIKVDYIELYRGRFKLNTVITDYYYNFSCKIDVNNQREIIEAKKSETIDLLSEKSLDDKPITKIDTVDVLTKFKEIFIDARVELSAKTYPFYINLGDREYGNESISLNLFNKAINVGPEISVNESIITVALGLNKENFTYFKSSYNGTRVELNVTGLDFEIAFNRTDLVINKWIERRIYNANGSLQNANRLDFSTTNHRFNLPDYSEKITLNKDEIVLFMVNIGVAGIENLVGGVTFYEKPSAQFFTIDTYEDTITESARLIDIGKQCLKSITNNAVSVIAPRYLDVGGNFYDIYATSGLFLRQYVNQPFYATWKGFTEYIMNSFNCDYQINGNEVFIGHESDFYQNVEMERILFSPNDNSFKVSPNDRLVKSNFSLGYDKYEDDKASSNTIDSFHVKSEWYLSNSQPLDDAKTDFNIGYVADQYMIENTRRESFNKDSTKTIPNDKDIYVIDTITEGGILQNRSDQGFVTDKIYSPETTYNLRLSVKRLMFDYFSEMLSNISQYTKDVISWKNTMYLNNREAKTNADETVITSQFEIIEGADITPDQLQAPTLTGDIYELDLAYRIKYNAFMQLASKIINDKGYVTLHDGNGAEVQLFISGLKYSWENEKIYNIKGERKYE